MKKILLGIALIYIVIRLPLLDQLYLLHDERDIVLSGYSVAKTGMDLFGNTFPIRFEGINPDNPLFAIYFSALGWLFTPAKGAFMARLPFLLVSTLLIFLVYEFVYKITKDKKTALASTVIYCFSPWIFHLTRLSMDVTVGIVYLMAAILFYLNRRLIPAFLFFFLTFFTYQGFRVLIPFLLIYLELYFYLKDRNRKQFIKYAGINLAFFIVMILAVLAIDARVTQNRFDQLIFSKNEQIAYEVNLKRTTSIAPPFVSRLFHNKVTVSIDYVIANFMRGMDPLYLFKEGDYSPINGNGVTGQFFLVFFPFFYLGILALGKKKDIMGYYLVGFGILSLLPALVRAGSVTFAIRAMPSGIAVAYLLILGLQSGLNIHKHLSKPLRLLTTAVVLSVLAVNLTYFIYDYYLRRPITVGELFNEHERQLVNYITERPDKRYVVYHTNPREPFLSYFFLSDLPIETVQSQLKHTTGMDAGRVMFVKCGRNKGFLKESKVIIHERCLSDEEYIWLPLNRKVTKGIPYQDFSKKTAFFVIE